MGPVVQLETEDLKESRGSEALPEPLVHQEEPSGREGQRDPRGPQENQANQAYLESQDGLVNWGKLEDQVKRETEERKETKVKLVKWG